MGLLDYNWVVPTVSGKQQRCPSHVLTFTATFFTANQHRIYETRISGRYAPLLLASIKALQALVIGPLKPSWEHNFVRVYDGVDVFVSIMS